MGLFSHVLGQTISGLLGRDAARPRRRYTTPRPTPQHHNPPATTLRTMGLPQAPFPTRIAPASAQPPRPRRAPIQQSHRRQGRPNPPVLPAGVGWSFVAEMEGTEPRAFVPPDGGRPDANSGVTVAHGFDLGGETPESLRRMGLREEIVTRLTPYLGHRGADAEAFVRRHPLPVSEEEQRELDAYVFPRTYEGVAANFDRDAQGTTFSELPEEAQTVIASVAHQYGPNLATRTPNFWRQVTTGDWEAAVQELRDFGDVHRQRRANEADRLQRGIDRGALRRGQ